MKIIEKGSLSKFDNLPLEDKLSEKELSLIAGGIDDSEGICICYKNSFLSCSSPNAQENNQICPCLLGVYTCPTNK